MKELREKRNLSQAEVARDLNISRQSYNFYENAKRDPDTATLKRLAKYFEVSVDYLIDYNDEPTQTEISLSPERERLIKEITEANDIDLKELEQILNYVKSKKTKNQEAATTETIA